MTLMKCDGYAHVFTAERMGKNPWCDCGETRNDWYRRTLVQKLLGLPKKPKS